MLINLDTARQFLRLDGNWEDPTVALAIGDAERQAAEYLNRTIYATQTALDAANDATGIVLNDAIRIAILMMVTGTFDKRGGEGQAEYDMAARTKLQPFRRGLGV